MRKIKKTNYRNENLYCIYSKEKIHIGEEYYVVIEECLGDLISKTVKEEYIDCIDDEEDEIEEEFEQE